MDIFWLQIPVLLTLSAYKSSVQGVPMLESRCADLGRYIQNCTDSHEYNLIDNMPIVLNATEIKSFCKYKDTILSCIEETLYPCRDRLTGIYAVVYDFMVFNVTYNTLCNNMELTWLSETFCITQIHTKMRECRAERDTILADVIDTGSTGVYCQRLEELYKCNTYETSTDCDEKHSDYLTNFYRDMLTPSACVNPYRNIHVAYKSPTVATPGADYANAAGYFGVCYVLNVLVLIGIVVLWY